MSWFRAQASQDFSVSGAFLLAIAAASAACSANSAPNPAGDVAGASSGGSAGTSPAGVSGSMTGGAASGGAGSGPGGAATNGGVPPVGGGRPGSLNKSTRDQPFRTADKATPAALEAEKTVTTTHDLGFQFMTPYGTGYPLTQTANCLDVLKPAAAPLAGRFRKPVGVIQ